MNETIVVAKYPYHLTYHKNSSDSIKWVLLHGFLGSKVDFDSIVEALPGEVLTFNLLGFGPNAPLVEDPTRFDMSSQINDIQLILNHINWEDINLFGYSMGGRLALGYTITHPERVGHLFLESTTAGIAEAIDRKKRQDADKKKSEQILQDFELFVQHWEQLPLFKSQESQPLAKRQMIRAQRLSQNPKNMAQSLIRMGTGAQPNFWPALSGIKMPTTIFVGEHDHKFNHIADKMLNLLPHGQKIVIQGAGHNVHFEAPEQLIMEIQRVLH